ncbi:hypothetical protein Ddye_015331 [Dipteronia dyeriana]|uniref:NAC domain-containing protein n=1 Tax=Dipteronia dyeriana TaxID=168575 RepID=A0AAD9U4P3_9ROSI|nr:hypothetical protein Ddye_015329 [Dipteronia dyeriana]KAK2647842.1 hypothetical protein Ddye_015331 [Dipteronia dyeriana]
MAAGFGLAVGMKFHPSDKDLVGFYLLNKICKKTESFNDLERVLVNECDLYGCEEAWQIWESYGGAHLEDGEGLHLFTRLKKVSARGSRVSRRVGSGTWAGEDGGEKIFVGDVVGFKKRFRYENRHSPQHDGAWIMHEFALDSNMFMGPNENDIVLCCLRKNLSGGRRGPEKKRKRNPSCDSESSKSSKVQVQENQAHVLSETQTSVPKQVDSCDSESSKSSKVLVQENQTHELSETQTSVALMDSSTRVTTQFDWVDAADDDVWLEFLNTPTSPDLDNTDLCSLDYVF